MKVWMLCYKGWFLCKGKLEQQHKENEESGNVNILGKRFLVRGSNTCRGPETQFEWLHSRDAKKAAVTLDEWISGKC